MTFEEFFTKKKISLPQLQSGEPGLFAEFKTHYEQMGEKSFDHTKKYWFNQLRRRFPASADAPSEKVEMENPIAEQTVIDTLSSTVAAPTAVAPGYKPRFRAASTTPDITETSATSEQTRELGASPSDITPTTGFKPRFKAPPTKSVDQLSGDDKSNVTNEAASGISNATEAARSAPNFKPHFKAAVTNKPAEEAATVPIAGSPSEEKPGEAEAPKPAAGFKPRFKAVGTNKPLEEEAQAQPIAGSQSEEKPGEAEASKPAVGFKPRFKAGVTNKPLEEEAQAQPIAGSPSEEEPGEAEASKPAVGFKPRFRAGLTGKPVEGTPVADEQSEKAKSADALAEIPSAPAPDAAPNEAAEEKPKPVGFKPRFNAAKMKPKDPEA